MVPSFTGKVSLGSPSSKPLGVYFGGTPISVGGVLSCAGGSGADCFTSDRLECDGLSLRFDELSSDAFGDRYGGWSCEAGVNGGVGLPGIGECWDDEAQFLYWRRAVDGCCCCCCC